MLLKAKSDYNIDLSKAYMLGDKETDRQCAINGGINFFFLVDKYYNILKIVNNILTNKN